MATPNQIEQERPPFSKGQAVQAKYGDMRFIREGSRYRVMDVRRSDDCESGWMVDVYYMCRGRIPKAAAPIGSVDSDWFIGVRR